MSDTTKMMLVVEAGKAKGKKIILKKTEYTLGSERKSSIKLVGEFVSPLHAIIKLRDEGQWVIQNRSPNQTLVNNQIVDTKPLVVGDSIQIGASNLLRFDLVSKREPKAKSSSSGSASSGAIAALLKKPMVMVGLIVYSVVIGLFFVFLSGKTSESQSTGWSRDKIGASIEASVEQIFGKDYQDYWQQDIEFDDSSIISHPSAFDDIITRPDGDGQPPSEQQIRLAKSLMATVSMKLENAWHFEQQGRWAEALELYEQSMDLVPDINLPVTRLIVERKRWVQKKSKNKK